MEFEEPIFEILIFVICCAAYLDFFFLKCVRIVGILMYDCLPVRYFYYMIIDEFIVYIDIFKMSCNVSDVMIDRQNVVGYSYE
jgi:hypothetical protein